MRLRDTDLTDLPPPLDWIRSDLEEIAVDTAAGSNGSAQTGTARVKRGMAEMLKGGVIMDVVTPSRPASPRAQAPSR